MGHRCGGDLVAVVKPKAKRKRRDTVESLASRMRAMERRIRTLEDRTHLARVDAQGARHHSRTMLDHVERLLREKETLVTRLTNGTGPLPPELQR